MKQSKEDTSRITLVEEIHPLEQDIARAGKPKSRFNIKDELYRVIIQNMQEGFFLCDLQGNILDANNAFCRMLGYNREELLLMTPLDFDVEFMKSPEKLNQRILKDKEEGGASTFETRHRRKDGLIIDVVVSSKFLDIGPGLFFCFHRDITEQKQAKEMLQQSEEKLRLMFDSVGDSITVTDLDGNIVQTNEATVHMHGYKSKEELIGRPGFELIAKRNRSRVDRDMRRLLEGGAIKTNEYTFLAKDGGEFPGELKAAPFRDASGNKVGVIIIAKDITERKKLEEELKRYNEHLGELVAQRTLELTEANARLKELYQREKELRKEMEEQTKRTINFVRTLIHEIKTPFTPMIGASEILVQSLEDEGLNRIAKNINRGAHNLNNRINDLMDLITGEADLIKLECHNMDIFLLLSEVVEYTAPEAKRKEQTLVLNIGTHPREIYADYDRLRQIILNLINNALKFTPQGGRITVGTQAKDGKLVISIADTGCGIDEVDQQSLFEHSKLLRLGQIKTGSLGLGLPLSKMLVELHGGKIWVDSQKGSGSIFSFSIPVKANS